MQPVSDNKQMPLVWNNGQNISFQSIFLADSVFAGRIQKRKISNEVPRAF